MTDAAPSSTALKISLISARVGTRACSMEASICVTTMNGVPLSRQSAAMRFCTAGTSQSGTALPRSPRAITISSACGKSSASASTPRRFSIFAKRRISAPPHSSMAARTAFRSSEPRTNGCMTAVTPHDGASARLSRSCAVMAGSAISTPGSAALLRERSMPPRSMTAHSALSARRRSFPSSRRMLCPFVTARSTSSGNGMPLSPSATHSPSRSVIGSRSCPTRSSGPCISSSRPMLRPVSRSAVRTASRYGCASRSVVCDKLSRMPVIPAPIIRASVAASAHDGPSVPYISTLIRSLSPFFPIVHRAAPARNKKTRCFTRNSAFSRFYWIIPYTAARGWR